MPDIFVQFLDVYGRLFISAILIEWGLCRWQNRKFIKKNIATFFIFAIALNFVVNNAIRENNQHYTLNEIKTSPHD